MKIIYGHDYYDNALAYGRDETLVFVREKEHFMADKDVPCRIGGIKDINFRDEDGYRIDRDYRRGYFQVNKVEFTIGYPVVIFCGKIYRGVRISFSNSSTILMWKIEELQEWLNKMKITPVITERWAKNLKDAKEVSLQSMISVSDAPKELMDFLGTNKISIAIRDDRNFYAYRYVGKVPDHFKPWHINSDTLKNMEFYKAVDAFTAFQELSMWIGGVLPSSGNPMVQIADPVRIEKHGFDKRTSFRNMKRD